MYISPINQYFFNVTAFPCARENVMYRSRSVRRTRDLFSTRAISRQASGLRFCATFAQISRARGRKEFAALLWQTGAEWPALLTSRLNVTAGTAGRYHHEKTGSQLDLVGFGISCRWGSSRRRLAINLYPVTRRAVPSQLNEAPSVFFFNSLDSCTHVTRDKGTPVTRGRRTLYYAAMIFSFQLQQLCLASPYLRILLRQEFHMKD